jgi:predicted glutamine amidotransferase
MCGIVGIFGLIDKTRIGMFEDMLAMDGVRGKDSTGLAVISPKSVTVVKDVLLADKLLDNEAYKLAKKVKPLCLIGHNRAATYGKVIKENAHPFQYKHITMVHNGTLENRWRLPDWWKYDTDSEALARCIADHGIETTWKVLEGAATLVWWDSNTQTLNVLSNGKRPFFLQPLKNSDGLVWSSERWTLLTAALRSGVEFAKVEKVYTPIADKLYTFKWLAAQKMFTFEEKQLQTFKFGNTIPGYHAYNPAWDQKPSKKKKKHKNKRGSGTAGVIKSAAESASVFQEWKGRYVERKSDNDDTPFSDQDYSDEAVKARYPELFDDALNGLPGPSNTNDRTDADLDTRGVPFRPKTGQAGKAPEKNVRTAERFKQLFDLVDLNAKHFTHDWFLVNYTSCCECGADFNYNDYFTARVLREGTAICDLCQRDAWIISGIEPDQIRLQ